MQSSSVLLRLGLSSLLSVLLWLRCQDAVGTAVRVVVGATARVCGERVHDPGDSRVALVVDRSRVGGERRMQIYGVSLLRWHINVIAVPILAMAFGSGTVRRRLVVSALGASLLVLLDGVTVFIYLWLGVHRLRGAPVVSVRVDEQLAYGAAVYAVKVLPVIAWAAVYLALRSKRFARIGDDAPHRGAPASLEGSP